MICTRSSLETGKWKRNDWIVGWKVTKCALDLFGPRQPAVRLQIVPHQASNQQETISSLASFPAINLWTTNPSSVLNQLVEAQIWDNFSAVWFCVKFLQRQIVQFWSDKNYVKSSATTIWQIFDGFLILAASIQFPHFQGIRELSLHSQFVVELPTGDFGVGTTIILWFPLFLQIVDEMLHLSYDLKIVSYVSLVAFLISNCRMCLWWLWLTRFMPKLAAIQSQKYWKLLYSSNL